MDIDIVGIIMRMHNRVGNTGEPGLSAMGPHEGRRYSRSAEVDTDDYSRPQNRPRARCRSNTTIDLCKTRLNLTRSEVAILVG